MANTVTNIDLTNTFGEWVATTTQLVNEYNILATQDWSKTEGDFIIETANAAFIVQNGSSATFQVPVEISGASANLTVRTGSSFQELATFSNTANSIAASGNVSFSKSLQVSNSIYTSVVYAANLVSQTIDNLYIDLDSTRSYVNSAIGVFTGDFSQLEQDLYEYVDTANTNLKLYTDSRITANAVSANAVISKANTDLKLYTDSRISANAVSANAVISKANTDLKSYSDNTFAPRNSPTITGGSWSGATLTNPTVTNYTETTHNVTGSTTVNLNNGTLQKITTNGNITITLPSSVAGKSYVILVAYTGNHTVTWAGGSTIKWSYGIQPPQTKINGKVDIFTFFCDGVNTYGGTFGPNF